MSDAKTFLAAIPFLLLASVESGAEPVTVTLKPDVQYQTILGWGKSTPHAPAPAMLREQVLERAVEDLGLTRLRLEPPSGNRSTTRNWEWLNDNGDPDETNWSALNTAALDARVEEWLVPFKKRVEARGEPFNLYVSPSFFDGGSSGTVPAWLLHSPGEYAEWALAILRRLKEQHGVVADFYCICNEAGNNNTFRPDVVARMIKTLGPKLVELGYPTKIQFPESVNVDVAWQYIQAARDDPEIWKHVGLVAYHLYGGNTAQTLPRIRDFARERGLPTAQTEFMGLTINHLYDDLVLGGVSYWEIYGLGGPDYQDTVSHVDSTSFQGGPHYWDFRQVLHYVRPGAVRIEATSAAPSLRPLAFSRNGKTTTVLINTTQPLQPQTVNITGLPPGDYGVCHSVKGQPYQELGVRKVDAVGTLAVDVAADSVLTIYPYAGTNQPPTVTSWSARPNCISVANGKTILSASATDPENEAVSCAWSVKVQPEGSKATLTRPGAFQTEATDLSVPGEYIFSVAISDGKNTVRREILLNVFRDNQPPRIVDLHNRLPVMVVLPQSTTELRGGASDIERDPIAFQWNVVRQPEGSNVALETPTQPRCKVSNISVPGEIMFRLEARDPTHTVSEDLTVTVFPESNVPTIANVRAEPSRVVPPASDAVLSTETSDPDGDTLTHWWTVKSAPAGTKPVIEKPGAVRTAVRGLTERGTYRFALAVINRTKVVTAEVPLVVAMDPDELKKLPTSDPPAERNKGGETLARGTVKGTVKAKAQAWIEVTSDSGKTERYIPPWRGGLPKDGGGPDKEIVQQIANLKIGDRVRVQWSVDNHLRVEQVEPD